MNTIRKKRTFRSNKLSETEPNSVKQNKTQSAKLDPCNNLTGADFWQERPNRKKGIKSVFTSPVLQVTHMHDVFHVNGLHRMGKDNKI